METIYDFIADLTDEIKKKEYKRLMNFDLKEAQLEYNKISFKSEKEIIEFYTEMYQQASQTGYTDTLKKEWINTLDRDKHIYEYILEVYWGITRWNLYTIYFEKQEKYEICDYIIKIKQHTKHINVIKLEYLFNSNKNKIKKRFNEYDNAIRNICEQLNTI